MTKENKGKGLQLYLSRPWESIKTFYLILTWVVLGIQLELVGPTLNILAQNTSVAYAGISTILIARSAGYLIGNVVGALAQNVVKKFPELLLSLAFILAAAIVFATPRIDDLLILSGAFFLQGISQGTTDLGGTSLMLAMWKDDVAAPLNLVHLGFGIGAVIGNFLVKPFLPPEDPSTPTSTPSSNDKSLVEQQRANQAIRIPYSVAAVICLIIGLGHLFIFFYEQVRQRRSARNEETNASVVSKRRAEEKIEGEKYSPYSPRSCGHGSFSYGFLMSFFWIIYMFFLSGNDQTFGKFFFSYLKSPEFAISNEGATWGMIFYWASYSVGRLICAIITSFLSVESVLSGLWVCGLLLALTWGIFVWAVGLSSTSLFVLGGFTGLVFSPTFPLSFGYLNRRLNVNPFLLGFVLCGGSIGAMVFQKLGGIILDENANHFPALLIVCVILSIVFYLSASILSWKFFRNRSQAQSNAFKPNRSEEEEEMEVYLSNNNGND